MPVNISDDAEIDWIRLRVQGSDPVADDGTHARLYVKADGLYIRFPAGAVLGPLISATFSEQATPAAPAANKVTLFAADVAGETRLFTLDSASSNYRIPHLFTELNDVPAAYDPGTAGDTVKVNAFEDGLEFVP